MSHKIVYLPKDVKVIKSQNQYLFTGPLGSFKSENEQIELLRNAVNDIVGLKIKHKDTKSLMITEARILNNKLIGITSGYRITLRLVGLGYRASIIKRSENNRLLALKIGYNDIVYIKLPDEINARVHSKTTIFLTGNNKQVLNMFASEIRAKRKPEPYKGKGIFTNNETIVLKSGKKDRQ